MGTNGNLLVTQDVVLGLCYLVIGCFSMARIYRNVQAGGSRKVIAAFNLLIFLSSASRAVWFLVPNYCLEPSYTPVAISVHSMDYSHRGGVYSSSYSGFGYSYSDSSSYGHSHSKSTSNSSISTGTSIDSETYSDSYSGYWVGTLISELLLQIGSLSLYGIFILISCYWQHMLNKLDSTTTADSANYGTLTWFGMIMLVLLIIQCVNIFLYVFDKINSQGMILYDSIFLALLSLATVTRITLLSNKIKLVLNTLEAANRNNSKPQIRRIFAIMLVADLFFVSRVVLECALAIALIALMHGKLSVIFLCPT